jgi:hypothetical protein
MKTLVYSHSDYADITQIQLEHISKFIKPTLLFNKKNDLYDTILYDDSFQYAERVLSSIKDIKEEYIFFIHDIDVVLNMDLSYLNELVDIMKKNNIDRIDLKHQNIITEPLYVTEQICLSKTSFPQDQYVYNVNPSIWKTKTMINTFYLFRNESYRSIEHSKIQSYCSDKFNFYTTFSKNPINMGYYDCYEQFKYLHISHYGQFMPDDITKNKMSKSNNDIYHNIINKYNLKNGNRKFKAEMH